MDAEPNIWTPQRSQLREWFRLNAPSLLCLYEGCVKLLYEKSNPARHHFIATAVRDIINILPQAIGAGRIGRGLDYRQHVEKIVKHWPATSLVDGEESEKSGTIAVPARAYVATEELVNAHCNHPVQRTRTAHLLRALIERKSLDSNVPIDRLVDAVRDVHTWFRQWDHASDKAREPPTDSEIQKQFASLEQALHVIVGQFFFGTDELDAILKATNE